MSLGRFMLVLHSHMPYVLSHGKSPHGTDWIFESAAECYLPLLDVLSRLEQEDIKPKWTVNITPILAEQLEDPSFKDGFEEYCQEQIDVAIGDQKNFRKDESLWMDGMAAWWQRYYTKALVDFKEKWNHSICSGFKHFQDIGSIEIITSCATHGYIPLQSTENSIYAQVKIGKETYKKHFGCYPRGFWLPECAYRPSYSWKSPVSENAEEWSRHSTDSFLANEGIEYFFVDSHMIRGGKPIGTYGELFPQLNTMFKRSEKMFTPPPEYRNEYEHYKLPSGVTCFARDPQSTVRVWSSEAGYPGTPDYLEFHKKLFPGRLRYWRVSEEKDDLGSKKPYNPWSAFNRIYEQACDFVNSIKDNLGRYKDLSGECGNLVAMYDTELFGHWWWEGPEFLYEVAKLLHSESSLEKLTGGELLDKYPSNREITLPEGSWGEGGYHYIWFNKENEWTWKELYPLQEKFKNLSAKYSSLQIDKVLERLLNQSARELLLAESSDWQFLISTKSARDYSELRFSYHINCLSKLLEYCENYSEFSALDDDALAFLENCEERDAPFKDVNFRTWDAYQASPLAISG